MSEPARTGPPTIDWMFLSAALSLAILVPLLGIPVYFRTDDVHWLGWAATHPDPLSAFDPAENLFGYYRPLPTLLWWVLFRFFGFQPLGYQIVLAALGVGAMVPLARIGRRLAGGSWGALAAVGLFHAAFVSILYFYYWFSAITFALELLFLALALDALSDGKRIPGRPVHFAIFALLAGLAKQPALLVIPAVTITFLLLESGSPRRRFLWGAGVAAVALLLMLVTPFTAQRPEALGHLAGDERTRYLLDRLRFYAGVLLRGPAGMLGAAGALVALASWRGERRPSSLVLYGVLPGILAGVSLARLDPALAIGPWLALLVAASVVVPASRPWLAGFLVPAAALLLVDFHVSTYLIEPGLALTPALLLWWRPLLEAPAVRIESKLRRSALVIACVAPLVSLLAAYLLHDRVHPIKAMRDVRKVFRETVEQVIDEAPAGTIIGYLSYEELGETYADIRRRPLEQRVERHKTMNGAQLGKFLRLRGRADLSVVPVAEAWAASDSAGAPVWLLAVTAAERAELAARSGAREVAWTRQGSAEAALFRVGSPNSVKK
ncbi:MAG TPA: hypothetical protein VF720_02645 [Candidatus Eisenbacteria bacterium]